ncbi:uncharacterized protein LOC102151328 isoform X1 [Canis lupus familiaris]|uniref:uncharacterized protein LOC102151328 isoform X1 n=1 Tax=Canis lupus familiaris TaxID=9615 RepID=UPI0018F7D2E0|nr:uncharacterized protein LOC102151328 isoform X1 [Canis lupus familiaris]
MQRGDSHVVKETQGTCSGRGRDWREAPGSPRKLGEKEGRMVSRCSQEAQPRHLQCRHRLHNVTECVSIAASYPVCDHLLRQPQEMSAVYFYLYLESSSGNEVNQESQCCSFQTWEQKTRFQTHTHGDPMPDFKKTVIHPDTKAQQLRVNLKYSQSSPSALPRKIEHKCQMTCGKDSSSKEWLDCPDFIAPTLACQQALAIPNDPTGLLYH